MSEKVVLPNFDLPRDSTRLAMRVLWVMGGVVVVATLALGMAMWHHRSLEIATVQEAAAKAEAARRAAMAPPPAPAPQVVEKATPGGSATTFANIAAGSATGSAPGSASAAAPAGADADHAAARAHSRRGAKAGRGHGMRGAALLEKIDGKGAKPASKPAKPAGGHAKSDDDFIDSLLKK
jgi:hypothetical protein